MKAYLDTYGTTFVQPEKQSIKNIEYSMDTFIKSKSLIKEKDSWTQGGMARDSENVLCPIASKNACKFCTVGAMSRVLHDMDASIEMTNMVINNFWFMSELENNIVNWNDNPSTTHDQILAMFDKIIDECEIIISNSKGNENEN